MLITDREEYLRIWDMVYERLGFEPSYDHRGHSMEVPLPFDIRERYSVYATDGLPVDKIDELYKKMTSVLADITPAGGKVYALDWQHSLFLFDPRDKEDMKTVYVEDEKYSGGGYYAYFPEFLPDGDYYFFIAEDFSFGWLGHPWRQEIWVFGEKLLAFMEENYKTLGFEKLV
ncbi:DUF2716 domain-containing protein [Ruminococcus sp.]|uniref:DUF2716 domain-containing protein n=1 Tax=Ruminococcus sp. TaxID=41978 RepID=UPI0025DE5E68|nr:DUF2716 domain-containing protein [Ruminococcus sp.]MBQ8967847.1 DUF2716 domain-containing protein [Ruminococcus sp.]